MTKDISISFIKTHPDAQLPKRNNDQLDGTGDTGYDVYAVEDAVIPAHSTGVVEVGLEIGYIEPGYWIRVESRSGLFFKYNITCFFGIIDNGYTGVLGISLINNGLHDYQVKKGDRIAQLVVYKLIEPKINWIEKKQETNRGQKGFGSSGR
jgi:dUTP pyrophosphatase